MADFSWVHDEEDRRKLKNLWDKQASDFDKVCREISAKQFGWRGLSAKKPN